MAALGWIKLLINIIVIAIIGGIIFTVIYFFKSIIECIKHPFECISRLIVGEEEFAKATYDPKIDGTEEEYTKKVKELQYKEMKDLYDIQNNVISYNDMLLPITGISNGVPANLTSTRMYIKDLLKMKGINATDVFDSFDTAATSNNGIESILLSGKFPHIYSFIPNCVQTCSKKLLRFNLLFSLDDSPSVKVINFKKLFLLLDNFFIVPPQPKVSSSG